MYGSSRDAADGLAAKVLQSVRTVALLQAHGAHAHTAQRYAGLQSLFIRRLQLTHLRQVSGDIAGSSPWRTCVC